MPYVKETRYSADGMNNRHLAVTTHSDHGRFTITTSNQCVKHNITIQITTDIQKF